ncbi:MAG: EamA family transporter RarD [Robiginitomaculum sp.]|nr:EamA family transporter RarD [Robiginitomaculum sp.]
MNNKSTIISTAHYGLLAGIAAYVMWGFFPVYFKITQDVPPLEILAHRIVWSLPFAAIIIYFRKQWSHIWLAARNLKTLGALTLAALLIAFNWGLYIWAVQDSQIFQASLGYYINPLIFVLVGVVFLGETLSRLQLLAVTFATVGVALLTFYGGQFPWIALSLAASFTIYGVIRKQVKIGAVPGLFIEISVLFIPAVLYLVYLSKQGGMVFLHGDMSMNILLILAGPLTVLPLVAFAFAARRLRLSTLGFLQFIGPSLQFLMGILYGEKLTTSVLLCFGFIWVAVIIFTWDAVATKKRIITSQQ